MNFFFFVWSIHSVRKKSLVERVSESEASQSVMNAAAAGGGSMRSFKKFWDYVLHLDNKSKESGCWPQSPASTATHTRAQWSHQMLAGAPSLHPSLLSLSLSLPFLHFSVGFFLCVSWSLAAALFLSPPQPSFFLGVFLELGFACMRLLGYFTASLEFLLDDGRVGSSFVLKNQDLMSRSIILWMT